jgi:cystathionine gamma-synthase
VAKQKRNNKTLNKKSISTAAIHSGSPKKVFADALVFPIFQTSTYTYKDVKEIEDFTLRGKKRFEYGRYGNPTTELAERRLAELEAAEDCILFASGMNAITTTVLTFVAPGDHIVVTDDCYRRTRRFCNVYLKQFGVDAAFVPFGDYQAMDSAIRDNTRLILSESPTNPYLKVFDFVKVKKIAEKHKILTLIDSTLSTPANCRPLEYGMDVVLQSCTKYLSGHNDILAGASLGSKKLLNKIRDLYRTLGGVIDPHCSYLLLRGLKTFAVRLQRQNASALKIAGFLENHPRVKRVYYPFLKSHPYNRLAKKQMSGGGGIVTFEIKGKLSNAKRFLNNLKLCSIGPSLGGAETLITSPAIVNYYEYTKDQRQQMQITDTLLRLSVGLEDVEDIIEDLKKALKNSA